MVYIRPRLLALVGLCVIASLSLAAPSQENDMQMRSTPPTNPSPAGAVFALLPTKESVHVDIKSSDESSKKDAPDKHAAEKDAEEKDADTPKESSAPQTSSAQSSTDKETPSETKSSKHSKDKKPAADSTARRRLPAADIDQARLDRRSPRLLYRRMYRLAALSGWACRRKALGNCHLLCKQGCRPNGKWGWNHLCKPCWRHPRLVWQHIRKTGCRQGCKNENDRIRSHVHAQGLIHEHRYKQRWW
ncbi:hypothetical protein LshimejAT787_0501610 [Lyophyllum shimeji]|uniref:Uncharacterized protein n=1 Tax=Lyophyllum shimeji TaxID=47721 RepID=A0A9P3PN13_LYOSH|nr:hypothetical protein LshimejAT787_0501610 [Lyophyllum shimeji]